MILCGNGNIYGSGYAILASYNEDVNTSKFIKNVFTNGTLYGTYITSLPNTAGTASEIYSVDNDGFTVCAVTTSSYPIDNFWWYAIG